MNPLLSLYHLGILPRHDYLRDLHDTMSGVIVIVCLLCSNHTLCLHAIWDPISTCLSQPHLCVQNFAMGKPSSLVGVVDFKRRAATCQARRADLAYTAILHGRTAICVHSVPWSQSLELFPHLQGPVNAGAAANTGAGAAVAGHHSQPGATASAACPPSLATHRIVSWHAGARLVLSANARSYWPLS